MNKGSVLVIDRESYICVMCKRLLGNMGYHVEASCVYENALEILKNSKFDIILIDTDWHIERLKALRKIAANAKIIATSASPSIEAIVQSIRDGADWYAPKPFDESFFSVKIEEFMRMPNGAAVERELAAVRKLEELQNLKAEFVSNVSHELRSPLASIHGAVELLLEGMGGDVNEKGRILIEICQRNIMNMAGLITDLLDFSKLQTGNGAFLKTNDTLASMITAAINEVSELARRKGIHLESSLCAEGICIEADFLKIKQAIRNLLDNAIRHSPEGGKIKVKSSIQDNNGILITVADFGAGIPKEKYGVIFGEFCQADGSLERKHEGLGLGLAITKSIIEGHSGKIWVESEAGKETKFNIFLPTRPH